MEELAQEIQELMEISHYAGMDESLVQAGGGNSSVKIDEQRMLIKASGCSLGDLRPGVGYSCVDYSMLAERLDDATGDMTEKTGKELLSASLLEGGRPSIETFLHALTGRVTLHTHPVLVNVLAARRGGMEELRGLFPQAYFIGYATPGVALAQRYAREYREQQVAGEHVPLIFLKNHGLIVSGETVQAVIEHTEAVEERIAAYIGTTCRSSAQRELYQRLRRYGFFDQGGVLYRSEDGLIGAAAERFGVDGWRFDFCPDCVVYCGRRMLSLSDDAEGDIERFREIYGNPVVLMAKGTVYILAESLRKAKEIESVLRFSAEVALLNAGQEIAYLPDEEQMFLLGWESERYRRQMK